jgi:hypothetical protein
VAAPSFPGKFSPKMETARKVREKVCGQEGGAKARLRNEVVPKFRTETELVWEIINKLEYGRGCYGHAAICELCNI